ncbi:hypothetical protein RB594_008689 [Gaeumannomyces avenae]
MKSTIFSLGATALVCASTVLGVDLKCSLTKKCPKEAPCCGLYGDCGTGAFCLGGCDPRMSFSLESCMPAATCKSQKYSFNNLDKVADISKYLGDPKKSDWVAQGEPLVSDGALLLTMPPRSVGTVLSSTAYMWYGSVKAKIKTSRGAGVVTGFILFSDVKDEIDYEWVGTELEVAQTNYYFQGIPNYDNSKNISLSNTFDNWHTYEIQWTPDEITWLVDGQKGRTKKRSETWNATANQWNFPQTPSRVQLSLWPGGAETNPKGTVDWAGGNIDWNNHEDIKKHGFYYAMVESVEVSCMNSPNAPGTSKGSAYWYTDYRGTNDTVRDGDKRTTLKSLAGSGIDMDAGGSDASSSTSGGSASSPAQTGASAPPPQVPGGSLVGPGADGRAGSDGAAPAPPGADCNSKTFVQTCGQQQKNPAARAAPSSLAGGALAVMAALVAVAAL